MPKQRKSNGGGYSTGPGMVAPGYLINHQYSGPGKDCVDVPVRPGYMNMYSQRGLPGLSGGKRSMKYGKRGMKHGKHSMKHGKRSMKHVKYHGGTMLQPAPVEYMIPQTHSAPGVPPQQMQQPAQPPQMQQPAQPPQMQQPAQPPQMQQPAQSLQKGGRYGVFPEMGPLNPINGVGASGLAPFARIPCEAGTTNKLNPNMELQMATTAVPMRGGEFPRVNVGAADSMRYYAPTAGYRNDFEPLPAGGAVPGLTIQTPYDAHSGNMACATTGGSRGRRHVRFGGSLAPFSNVELEQIMNRVNFDGSKGGLPVKYGGRRRRTQRNKKQHKSKKARKNFFGF